MLLGKTCRYLHQLCNSQRIWRTLCQKMCPRVKEATDWRRPTILNYTKGMYCHPFVSRQRVYSSSVPPLTACGFHRFLATKDNVFVLDYMGTLFFLRSALVTCKYSHVKMELKRTWRYAVLCRNVKDFSSDPRNDAIYRTYLYVLASRETSGLTNTNQDSGQCDCVEVYMQSTGHRVFRMSFHPTMKFKQVVLLGPETERLLLLLTEEGKVYNLEVNETQLDQPRSYTVQLSMRKVSRSLSHVTVTQMYSNQSSVLYITDLGTVYLEVHSPAVYRDLFGTLQAFDSLDLEIPLAISLPTKVVLCSVGSNHLALVDEFGRIFMQGNNRFGQLGTGDKIDRGEPSQVCYLKNPVDIFCGLNHTLVLIDSADFVKEIYACGCGAGGRLPGWPKGSPSFVKLLMKVPSCARRFCSTRDCLYILSSYDTEEDVKYQILPNSRCEPPGTEENESGVRACEDYLGQLRRCASLPERVAKTKELVTQMSIRSYQKECLWEALGLIQRAAESSRGGTGAQQLL